MRKSKIEPFRDLVGTCSDAEIAEKANLTVSAVRAYRRKHGIPSYKNGLAAKEATSASRKTTKATKKTAKKTAKTKTSSTTSRSRVAAFQDQLGVLTDTAIAAKAGLTIGAVRAYRVRQGIPSAAENKRRARRATQSPPATTPTPVQAKPPTNYVWRVQYGDELTCLVSGGDLRAVGIVLATTGIREVQSVKRMGRLIE